MNSINTHKKFFLLTTCVLFFACSCGNMAKKNGLERIAILETQIVNLESSFSEIDLKQIELIHTDLGEKLDYIQIQYTDTIEKPEAIDLANFIATYKLSSKTIKEYTAVNGGIEFSKSQLEKIASDIENNLIPKDSIGVYLNDEQKAIEVLKEEISTLLTQSDVCAKDYAQYSTVINRLTDELALEIDE